MNIQDYLKNKLYGSEDKKEKTYDSGKIKNLEDYVKQQYDAYLPKDSTLPSLERQEYEAPSDEQIEQSAAGELQGYLNENEKAIRDSYAAKKSELEANKKSSQDLYEDSGDKLRSAYLQTAEALGNDSLKRGLARSSIAVNKQAEASKAYNDSLKELMETRNRNIAAIDEELNSLDTRLKSALDSFKISYAAKLTERMNELKEEREKNKLEALKYNNSLLKDEYNMQNSAEKEPEKDARDYMTNEQKGEVQRNIYNKAVEVLDSMPAEEAKEAFFGDPFFRNNLNDYYYYLLYYKYR